MRHKEGCKPEIYRDAERKVRLCRNCDWEQSEQDVMKVAMGSVDNKFVEDPKNRCPACSAVWKLIRDGLLMRKCVVCGYLEPAMRPKFKRELFCEACGRIDLVEPEEYWRRLRGNCNFCSSSNLVDYLEHIVSNKIGADTNFALVIESESGSLVKIPGAANSPPDKVTLGYDAASDLSEDSLISNGFEAPEELQKIPWWECDCICHKKRELREIAGCSPGCCSRVGEEVLDRERGIERKWQICWKELVICDSARETWEQVKKELYDFSQVMDNAAWVYCHVTGSRISKPLTDSTVVCAEADDYYAEAYEAEIKFFQDHATMTLHELRLAFDIFYPWWHWRFWQEKIFG